jgi:NADH:ubiquinone oxidoreductase subunit C
MFGVKFLFHGDLRRLLTDYGFLGHVLCKDFPLVGFLEYRYDDVFKLLLYEPISLAQSFRFFRFVNPWFK